MSRTCAKDAFLSEDEMWKWLFFNQIIGAYPYVDMETVEPESEAHDSSGHLCSMTPAVVQWWYSDPTGEDVPLAQDEQGFPVWNDIAEKRFAAWIGIAKRPAPGADRGE